MRTYFLITAMVSALLVLPIRAQDKTTLSLEKFSELKAFDGIQVQLVQGDKNEAIMEGEHKDAVSIVNKSGRLKVRLKLDKFLDGHKTTVTLYHTQSLVLLDVNEKAKIYSDSPLRVVSMEFRAQEGGEISLPIEAERVDIKATTGGIISLSGTAKVQQVHVNTGGIVKNEALKTEQTDVSVNAGGMATIHASDIVDAIVRAGGTITIHGNPKEIAETKFVGGKIITVD
jgi:hypothetical protein